MNRRGHIVLALAAVTMAGFLGADRGRTPSSISAAEQRDDVFWIKTELPDELLAGRLNVTNVSKTPAPIPLPKRSPRKRARTAQLAR